MKDMQRETVKDGKIKVRKLKERFTKTGALRDSQLSDVVNHDAQSTKRSVRKEARDYCKKVENKEKSNGQS